MKKKIPIKQKLSVILTSLLVFAFSAFIFTKFTSQQADAAWFDDTYAYRTLYRFTENTTADTNKKVLFELNTQAAITANKLQSDCDDIRFTDGNGQMLRYYVSVSGGAGVGCNDTSTDFYILMPEIHIGRNMVFIYYGNSQASSRSEANNFAEATYTPDSGPNAGSEEQSLSPLLYWPMSEGYSTTVNDGTTQNNDGTITGATWKTTDICAFNNCLYFDNSGDYISKAYSTDTELNPGTGSMTISAWFRHSSTAALDILIARYSSGGYKVYMDSSGYICFGIDDDVSFGPDDSACSTTSYADSKWHQVVGVKSGTSSITLYIDGNQIAQDASIAATSSISGSSPTFYAGVDSDGTSNLWQGFIDEIKYYNFAKTAAQIKTEYSSRSSTSQTSGSFGDNTANSNLTNGLVGFWKMEEASDATRTDSSGNGNTLTESTSDTIAQATGKFGYSADFESADTETLSNNAFTGLPSGTSMTLATWINIESAPSCSSCASEIINADLVLGLTEAESDDNVSAIQLQYWDGAWQNIGTTSNALAVSTWYHIALTYSAPTQTYTLYVNGIPQTTGTLSYTIGPVTDVTIGNTRNDYFDGKLDDVRVYNRSLSATEVNTLYNTGTPPIVHFKMDENTGTSTLYDSSGYGHNGTMTGFTQNNWSTGKFGQGLYFDNITTPYVNFYSSSLNTEFMPEIGTMMIWLKVQSATQWSPDVDDDTAITLQADGSNMVKIHIQNSSGRLETMYTGGAVTADLNYTTTSTDWIHAAITWNTVNDQVKHYINGVLQEIDTGLPTWTGALSSSRVTMGVETTSLADPWIGWLDDARVYNYELTSKQVVEAMNAGHPPPGSPISSAVGHWSLDEMNSTTAQDNTGNDNDLTLSTSSWTAAGKFSSAWNGTGSNPYISRADDNDFDFATGQDFTLGLWVKSDSTSNPAASEYLVDKQVATNNPGYSLRFNTSGFVVCEIDDDTTSFPEDAATGTTDYYDNTWHHIVCIRDITQDRLYLYVDGKLHAQDTDLSATGNLSNSDTLTVGARDTTAGGTDDFTGDIDEIKIYRSALSADEVKIDYNFSSSAAFGDPDDHDEEGFALPDPNAYWKFDDNTGSTTVESSGNSYTGTFNGATKWVTGRYGSGIDLDGNGDYVSTSHDPTETSAFTWSFWVYPRTQSTDDTFISAGNLTFAIYLNASGAIILCNDSVCTNTASSTNSALTSNAWNHVVITYNGTPSSNGAVNFYVNGINVTSDSNSNENSFVAGTNIGAYGGGTSNATDGIMDEVSFYASELTQSQVAYLYSRGNPMGYWQLDECQGNTAYDAAGSINGTIAISASGSQTSSGTCGSGVSTEAWSNGETGKFNYSLNFDGSDDEYIALTNNAYDAYTQGTVAMWVKPTDSGDSLQSIIGATDGTGTFTNAFEIQLDVTNNNFEIWMDGCAATDIIAAAPAHSNTTSWHHVAWVVSSSGNTMYVDGAPKTLTYSSGSSTDTCFFDDIAEGTTYYSLGCANDSSTCYDTEMYSGQIDDVRIYNYPLSAQQIKKVINQNAGQRFGPSSGSP